MKEPNGKYFFGLAKVGSKGQIVIPARARKIFNISCGSEVLLLGDENQGIAIVSPKIASEVLDSIMKKGEK